MTTKPRTEPVERLTAVEARRVLMRESPWAGRRGAWRWLSTPYFIIRDPGTLTPKQSAAADAAVPLAAVSVWWKGDPPELDRRKSLATRFSMMGTAAQRMTARRAHFHGLPAWVRNDGWPEWRAVYTTPERRALIVDAEFSAMFEALHPDGSWEVKRDTAMGPLVRLDSKGRVAGALLPVMPFPARYEGDSGV